jgi:hypothetical protein
MRPALNSAQVHHIVLAGRDRRPMVATRMPIGDCPQSVSDIVADWYELRGSNFLEYAAGSMVIGPRSVVVNTRSGEFVRSNRSLVPFAGHIEVAIWLRHQRENVTMPIAISCSLAGSQKAARVIICPLAVVQAELFSLIPF